MRARRTVASRHSSRRWFAESVDAQPVVLSALEQLAEAIMDGRMYIDVSYHGDYVRPASYLVYVCPKESK